MEATMEETAMELASTQARCRELEARLEEAAARPPGQAPAETLGAPTEELEALRRRLDEMEREKEGTVKTIAMLEFNNTHNQDKVRNMELSNQDLKDKISALTSRKEELERQLREGASDVIDGYIKEKEELEERLARETKEIEEKYRDEDKNLREQVEGLTEIRLSYEKQISQIEENNAEMHRKIGGVQTLRDQAIAEANQVKAQKQQLEKELEELTKVRVGLDEEVASLKATVQGLEDKVAAEESQGQSLKETIHTLNNNILNLQKQVQGLNETNSKLARDLEAESKARIETQDQLGVLARAHKLLEDARRAEQDTRTKLEEDNTKLQAKLETLTEMSKLPEKVSELQSQVETLEAANQTLTEKVQGAAGEDGGHAASDTSAAAPDTNKEPTLELQRLRSSLKAKEDEVNKIKLKLKEVQDKLRLAEVVSGEVEEQRARVREVEAQMAVLEERHRDHLRQVAMDAEHQVAVKVQECNQTITSAYDQQDSETNSLVQQHREALRTAQDEARDKAKALDSAVRSYEDKLKYEEQLGLLKTQHEAHMKEVESTWKARAEKLVSAREGQLQQEMDHLSQDWNKERRELERLTQVAAAAFRSGTDSVELLKKQVSAQRRELEDLKLNHSKEIGEMKALLELKRRSRGGGGGGVRMGGSLEEAAEFEYLKNILYQYMMGKETQTLSKVLCAVVKFDKKQQEEIIDYEEQRQSLTKAEDADVSREILSEGGCEQSKTL